MTCGIKNPSDYCIQTHGIYRECDRCDATSEEKAHKPEYLTDIHTESNPTWWQSTTMLENVHTQELKLTANLGALSFFCHYYTIWSPLIIEFPIKSICL